MPNLEAVIVCADTLETVADPHWRSAQLDMADPEVAKAVQAVAETRALWFDAHTENAKNELLNQDADRRTRLKMLLQQKGELASPELRQFAEAELLATAPARTDARLLFHQNFQDGFDIVIGNPPYEALSKSRDKDAIKRLADAKRYRTTGGGDLYNLFCETALSLAKPNGGVVTLIVPLSISFGRNKQALRNIFSQRSKCINLRHYDNNPGRTFTDSPTVRDIRNNQRITIISAICGHPQNPIIKSMGLQRWSSEERELCIKQRACTTSLKLDNKADARIAGQWPRIPTKEVADMVQSIVAQQKTLGSYQSLTGQLLAFPKTTRYFISSIPEGTVSPRSESFFTVANESDLCLAMAVLNSHVAYGWWRVFGDGFHVNSYELTTLNIPDSWAEDPQPAIELGQRLIDVMPDCITRHPREGVDWENVDFHTYAPDLIAELDRLHIAALGLPEEPLLTHLRIMRSSSSWKYP